ncbi:MAG: hypothetical protein AAF468_07495 [Pseudomonadota bacterium]
MLPFSEHELGILVATVELARHDVSVEKDVLKPMRPLQHVTLVLEDTENMLEQFWKTTGAAVKPLLMLVRRVRKAIQAALNAFEAVEETFDPGKSDKKK